MSQEKATTNINVPAAVVEIICTLHHAGHEAYIVGGCVRDALMGRTPHDWDICSSAKPETTMALFRGKKLSVIETGIKYGTVTIIIDSVPYEITTYRVDGDYSDGRHPNNVKFSHSLREDLSRRDFTVNAMAYDPFSATLMDFHGGAADITSHTLRCVGDPRIRFQEDALRILRAMRFAAVLGFSIDPETALAIHEQRKQLSNISKERIRNELCKLLCGIKAPEVMDEFKDVMAEIIPDLAPSFDFEQNNPWHVYDVWHHILASVGAAPQDEDSVVRLTMLFHDIGKPQCYKQDEDGIGHFHGHGEVSAAIARKALRNLRFDNERIDIITELIREHDKFIEPSENAVRRVLSRLSNEQQFDRLMEVRAADIAAQAPYKAEPRVEKIRILRQIKMKLDTEDNCFKLKDLAVNGKDLMSVGFRPGRQIGEELHYLFELVLDDPNKNRKDILLAFAEHDIATVI